MPPETRPAAFYFSQVADPPAQGDGSIRTPQQHGSSLLCSFSKTTIYFAEVLREFEMGKAEGAKVLSGQPCSQCMDALQMRLDSDAHHPQSTWPTAGDDGIKSSATSAEQQMGSSCPKARNLRPFGNCWTTTPISTKQQHPWSGG